MMPIRAIWMICFLGPQPFQKFVENTFLKIRRRLNAAGVFCAVRVIYRLQLFQDIDHLNATGAEKFDENFFADLAQLQYE